VNGDGKPDLIVANECSVADYPHCPDNGVLGVLVGNGDGTFQAAQSYSFGGLGAVSVIAEDLNGDGYVDLLVSSGSSVNILFGTGNGSFQPSAQIFASGGSIAVADVNGDGKLDILVVTPSTPTLNSTTSPSGTVNVLEGDGHGAFSLAQSFAAPVNGSIVIADVNGDGKPDLVVGAICSGCGNSGVGVFLGNGDGTFQPVRSYASSGADNVSVAVADLNGDGKLDIAVTNQCVNGFDCSASSIGVLLGNGDGTFRAAMTYQVAGLQFANVAAAVDLNGDGKLDLVFVDRDGSTGSTSGIIVYLGNGDGTFGPEQTYSSGGYMTNSLVVADFNNDGKPDIVLANLCAANNAQCASSSDGSEIAILLGNGDGTFQPAKTYNPGGSGTSSIAVADVNADGKLDVVVTNQGPNSFAVLLGNGDGTFQTANSFPSGGIDPISVAVADVNGDGKPDVLVSNFCADSTCQSNGLISVQLGDGKGGFTPFQSYSSGGNRTETLAVADFNRDGKLDIVVGNLCGPPPCALNGPIGVLDILLGNGDGTFQAASAIAMLPYAGGTGGQFAVADINGDGKLDIAAGLSGILLLGNGDGTFQTPLDLVAPGPGIVAADFNADGKMDLAIAVGNVVVLLNNTLTPDTTSLISSGTPTVVGQSVTFTATVTPMGSGTPGGTVTFKDGSTVLGTSPLSAGVAAFTTSALAVGAHSITASYAGNSNFAASVSTAFTQTVNAAPDFTISATPVTQALSPGQNTSFMLTVTPLNGSTQSITISCTGAPAKAACNPVTSVVILNGTSGSTVLINLTTTASSAFYPRGPANFPILRVWSFALAGILGGLTICFSVRAGQRAKYAFMYLLLIVLAGSGAGCGTRSGSQGIPGTPAGSYTLTITGTTGTGASVQSHSMPVTLVVN